MKQKGFTLLEVMVAMAVLSVALVLIFSQQATSISQGAEARIVTRATLLAQERMASVIAQEPLIEVEEEGEAEDSVPSFTWKQTVEESPVEGMKKVTVLVQWKEGDKVRDVRLVTYVASE